MHFMAIDEIQSQESDKLYLTTDLMRWSETVWILDMTRFLGYWNLRAQAQDIGLIDLWRDVLNRRHKDLYRVALASSPWQALLLLKKMQERGLSGLLSAKEGHGKYLYAEISWSVWNTLAQELRSTDQRYAKLPSHDFAKKMTNIGMKKPSDAKAISHTAVTKRFGKCIADCWQWTVNASPQPGALFAGDGFPWKPYHFQEQVAVGRFMEHPAQTWDELEPFLQLDCDLLIAEGIVGLITELTWDLTFDDFNVVSIPIKFRHPHDLKREQGEHRTVLLQAQYGFSEIARDWIEPYPFLLGWRLIVRATFAPEPTMESFFERDLTREHQEIELRRLENELPLALQSFACTNEISPEHSFSPSATGRPHDGAITGLAATAATRPLFLLPHPTPLDRVEGSLEFTEAVLNYWWESSRALERNYYRNVTPTGQVQWVYRDSSGKWFKHGIYG